VSAVIIYLNLILSVAAILGIYFNVKISRIKSIFLLWLITTFLFDIVGKYLNEHGTNTALALTYNTAVLIYSLISNAYYFVLFESRICKNIASVIGVLSVALNICLISSAGISFMNTNAVVVFAVSTLILTIFYIIDNSMTDSKQSLFMRPSFWINISMAVSSVMLIIRFGIAYLLFEQDLDFYTAIRYAHLYVQLFCNLLLIFAVVYPAYKYRNTTSFTIEL
jgi:hypothetical protein